MKVGYLHIAASAEGLSEELATLERIGCERVVIDSANKPGGPSVAFKTLVESLRSGDTLIVGSMAGIAVSVPQLLRLVLELADRGVHFRSLAERFNTDGEHGAVLKSVLRQLQDFQDRLDRRNEVAPATHLRRVGRPKSLSRDAIKRARALVQQGRSTEEVAQRFRVSRATLYRYLGGAE